MRHLATRKQPSPWTLLQRKHNVRFICLLHFSTYCLNTNYFISYIMSAHQSLGLPSSLLFGLLQHLLIFTLKEVPSTSQMTSTLPFPRQVICLTFNCILFMLPELMPCCIPSFRKYWDSALMMPLLPFWKISKPPVWHCCAPAQLYLLYKHNHLIWEFKWTMVKEVCFTWEMLSLVQQRFNASLGSS